MVILDTCALLWYLFEQDSLSKNAATLIQKSTAFSISSISIWEIGIKIKNKELEIPIPIRKLVDGINEADELEMIPVNGLLVLR